MAGNFFYNIVYVLFSPFQPSPAPLDVVPKLGDFWRCFFVDDGYGDHEGDGDDGDDFVGVELLLRKIGGCPLGRPILQYPPTLHYTQSYV